MSGKLCFTNRSISARFGRRRECLSVYTWAAELNKHSLVTEVSGALRYCFALAANTGYRAALAAHHTVDFSLCGMTSSLRNAASSSSADATAVVGVSAAGAPSSSSSMSIAPTLERFAGGGPSLIVGVAAGSQAALTAQLHYEM